MWSRASGTATEHSEPSPQKMRSGPRLVDYSAQRLRKLCMVAGFGGGTDGVIQTFRSLVSPWGNISIDQSSTWTSEVSDDNTPIEFSVAVADGRAEVRVLFEPQGAEPTLNAYRRAGLELNERLE